MNRETREYIDETARAVVNNNLLQAALSGTNLYAATESLLKSYKKLKATLEAVEEYGFVPPQKDKSITVAPPDNGYVPDWTDMRDEAVHERKRSYMRSQIQLEKLERIIREYSSNPYFIVVRMYYFGEYADGSDADARDLPRTIEDIAFELSETDFEHPHSDKTLAKKKQEIVRDMTVTIFGEAGAISNEMYKARKANRLKGEQNESP